MEIKLDLMVEGYYKFSMDEHFKDGKKTIKVYTVGIIE